MDIPKRVPLLEAKDVAFSFTTDRGSLLSRVSFQCEAGNLYGLVGGNGSGKTTILNLLSGFLAPQSGSIAYGGSLPRRHDPLTIRRLGGGLMRTFQVPALVGDLTVEQNLLLATVLPGETFTSVAGRVDGAAAKAAQVEARARLAALGLGPIAHSLASSLSYGQRRAVSVLMAVLSRAVVALLDEPFANLSEETLKKVQAVLKHEARGCRRVFVIVEHPPQHLVEYVDWFLLVEHGSVVVLDAKDPAAKARVWRSYASYGA